MSKTKKVVIISLYSAALVALKLALMVLPNIELVTFMFIIYGLTLPAQMTLMISVIFVSVETIMWGFGDWSFGYMWIWPIWILMIYSIKKIIKERPYFWALISAMWGFIFGILFALNHGIFYGLNYSFVYWVKGLNFDLIHVLSNYILTLVLFEPVLKLFKTQHRRMIK